MRLLRTLGVLCALCWSVAVAAGAARAMTQTEIDSFTKRKFSVYKIIPVDLDGDGRQEIVVGLEPLPPFWDKQNASLLVLRRVKGRLAKVWQWRAPPDYRYFSTNGDDIASLAPRLPRLALQVRDINGDGKPEIFAVPSLQQASEAYFQIHVWQLHRGRMVNLLQQPVTYRLRGGFKLDLFGSAQGSKRLLTWSFIWGDGEAHGEPHRYHLVLYTYTRGKYRRTLAFSSRRKYDDPSEVLHAFQRHVAKSGLREPFGF